MKQAIIILVAFFLLLQVQKIYAASPVIVTYPQTQLFLDTPFSLTATMSGLSTNTIYRIRIALAKTGTTSYFGSTFNGKDWYNGTPSPINYANFLNVTTDQEGAWSGDIQGQIQSQDANFPGESGSYDLKIGRYTQNGSSATWSAPVTINVVAPTNTPFPVTYKPSTKTSAYFTSIPTQVLSSQPPTLAETYGVEEKSPVIMQKYPTLRLSKEAILGASTSAVSTPSAIPRKPPQEIKGVSEKKFPFLIVAGGIMLIISAGGMVFFVRKKTKNITQE